VERLSTLNRFLPLWIALAMAGGLLLGTILPGIEDILDSMRIGTISLPIALGLLLMMYPVLAKVRYDELGHLTGDRRLLVSSLVLNWVVGPFLMFALAWVFLADQPESRTGLIIVGLVRCIAMVLIWSDLACADREATALLFAIRGDAITGEPFDVMRIAVPLLAYFALMFAVSFWSGYTLILPSKR
jgi:ACR3 family arsenite transporter